MWTDGAIIRISYAIFPSNRKAFLKHSSRYGIIKSSENIIKSRKAQHTPSTLMKECTTRERKKIRQTTLVKLTFIVHRFMFFPLTSASHAIWLAQIFVRFSCVWDDMYLNFVRYMKCICLPPLWAFVPRKRWIYCLSIKYGGNRFTSIVPIRFESIHFNFSVVIFGFLLFYLFFAITSPSCARCRVHWMKRLDLLEYNINHGSVMQVIPHILSLYLVRFKVRRDAIGIALLGFKFWLLDLVSLKLSKENWENTFLS